MALDKFRAAPLPNPPGDYDPQYIRQMIRVIENYFSQLDSNTPNHAQKYTANEFVANQYTDNAGNLVGGSITGTDITASNSVTTNILSSQVSVTGYERANGVWTDALISYGHKNGRTISDDIMVGDVYATNLYGDGEHVFRPYTVLQSSSNQTLSAVDVAVAVTYTTNDFPNVITIGSPTSRIVVSHAGIYQFTFSLQFSSTSTGTELVNVWFRKNGTDITASNSQFSMPPRKSAGVPSALIAVTPYMINLVANDYIEIMWNSSATTTSLAAISAVSYSAGVTPAIPATPSAIVAVQFISAKFPTPTYIAPLPVFGFGQIGTITVYTP
jgi:hypothetical protein